MISEEILKDVSVSDYYGHIVDETTDVSTKNQIIVIGRFVKGGKVKKRFLGFYSVPDISIFQVIRV